MKRAPGKRQVAHGIEHLVADELVLVAQAFHVDDAAVVADHHRIFERRAERIAGGPQAFDILHETEGAGAGNFAAENFAR